MKRLIYAAIVTCVIALTACEGEGRFKTAKEVFEGDHELFCMRADSVSENCEYMTVTDGYAQYMWMCDSSYVVSSVPVENVRIRLDESVLQPYIKYRWRQENRLDPNIQAAIKQNVVYVLLVCSEQTCPPALKPGSVAKQKPYLTENSETE